MLAEQSKSDFRFLAAGLKRGALGTWKDMAKTQKGRSSRKPSSRVGCALLVAPPTWACMGLTPDAPGNILRSQLKVPSLPRYQTCKSNMVYSRVRSKQDCKDLQSRNGRGAVTADSVDTERKMRGHDTHVYAHKFDEII